MAAADTGTFVPKFDDEINQAWRLVEDRVIQMAGGESSKINTALGIDGVLEYLDQAQATDKKAAEKYSEIKHIFHRTLQCIETVGGIVATGASYAFAPASTCYSALTFVISAWKGYEGIFESLASLLDKCTEFLDRLSYYTQFGMDAKLTKVACSHLYLFVEICDRSLKLKSKRHKLAAFVKQLFLNDDGVQDLLGAMKSLVDKEHGLVAAQTWKSSSEAAKYSKDGLDLARKIHNNIAEDKSQLKREKEMEKWKRTIVNALDLDQNILQDDVFNWEKAWKRHKAKLIEHSGEWLVNDERFKEWATGTNPNNRILGLEGRGGAGKTLLASNAILHLRKMKNIGSSRVVVAHNFLEPDPKSSAPTDTAMAVSRSLICQLAFSDEPYMKSVAAICEASTSFESPLEIWTRLLLQNKDLQNIDISFFLIFDGLGSDIDAFTHILKSFSDILLNQKVRILLAGTENMFHKIRIVGGVDVEKIVLGEPNKPDIELYINHRMGNMEMLSDQSRAHVSEIRAKILHDLMKATAGDYYKINRVLDSIAKTDDVEEINALLKTAGDTRPDQIEADIENLNQARTAKEISEINEIILWIWGGQHWMSPDEMEAVMELKALQSGGAGTTSLMTIQSKIKTKYTIFTADYNTINLKVPEMIDKIPHRKRDTSGEDSASESKDIHPAEINIVRHYLNAVCPPDLYKKFGFDEFFDLKMVRKFNYIYQDRDNGHVTLVIRCLTCLLEKDNQKVAAMMPYSANYLAAHMYLADLSLANRSLKSEAGEMLVRLFTEQYALDSLLSLHPIDSPITYSVGYFKQAMDPWLFTDVGLEAVSKWLNDSAVIEKVKDHPIVTAFKNNKDNLATIIFQPALKVASEDLFIHPTSKKATLYAFTLICHLISKEKEDFQFSQEIVLSPTLEMFQLVEERAQVILGFTERSAEWEGNAAKLLLELLGDKIPKSVAIERAKRALELDPGNWTASYAMFQADDSNEETGTLENLIEKLKADSQWREKEQNEEHLAKMMYELGDRYWYNEDTQKAIGVYSQTLGLRRSQTILSSFYPVLRDYTSKCKWSEIISFFDDIIQYPEDGNNFAGTFLGHSLALEPWEFCPTVSRSIEATGRMDLFDAITEKLEDVKDKFEIAEWAKISYNRGTVMVLIKGCEDTAIEIWEQLVTEYSSDGYSGIVKLSSNSIVEVCTRLVAAEGISPEKLQVYDRKVQMCLDVMMADPTQPADSYTPYAQYFRTRGKTDLARKTLQGPTKEALEMLYDDDIENDTTSFWYLSVIFAAMRDHENNFVAWHMMEQSTLEVRAEHDRRLKTHDEMIAAGVPIPQDFWIKKPMMAIAFCDGDLTGDCVKEFRSPDGFWVCLTGNEDKMYCESCYARLQDGKLDLEYGGNCISHEFLHLVQDKEKVAALPKGSVLVGDRVITLEEWKQEIKAKYVDFDKTV